MASKATSNNVVSFNVRFAEIYWYVPRNYARAIPSTKREELRTLLRNGWWASEPITAEEIKKAQEWDEAKTDFVSLCLEERQAMWDKLKADNSTDGIVALKVFEEMFVHNGKLIVPKYLGSVCYQRGSTFFDAMCLRRKDLQPGEATLVDTVPVLIATFKNQAELREAQVMENEGKLMGREGISDYDRLRNALYFYTVGYIQKRFREIFKDTTGQKLFYLCKLNSYFPNLHIIDRFLKKPDEEDSLPFGPYKHGVLGQLAARCEESKLAKGETLLKEEELRVFLLDVKKGKSEGNAEKIMQKESIQQLQTSIPNTAANEVAKAIYTNNADLLAKVSRVGPVCTAAMSADTAGFYPELESLVLAFMSEKQTQRVTSQAS